MLTIIWMLGTLVSFCLMAVGVRELSQALDVLQVLTVRSAVGLICVLVLMRLAKQKPSFNAANLKLNSLRNVFHFAGQYGWFLGIGLLPLAEVFALEFTVPIWTLIIAALFLGEEVNLRKVTSVLLGIIGVWVIVQPGSGIVDTASFIVLAAAVCYAVAHAVTKSLSGRESALSIMFHMCLMQLPLGLALSWQQWIWPSSSQWLWLVIIGVTALSANYCMAKAMRYADVTTVVTIDFLRLPMIALVGVWLYQEPFEIALLLGGALMLVGNLLNVKTRAIKPE